MGGGVVPVAGVVSVEEVEDDDESVVVVVIVVTVVAVVEVDELLGGPNICLCNSCLWTN